MQKNRLKRLFLLTLTVLLFTTVVPAEKVYVLIRVDDIFSMNSPIRPIENDEFLKAAEKHGARVVFAAIPNRLLQPVNENGLMTRALLDYRDRGHQIIQHGYNHMCAYSGDTSREFSTTEALEALDQQHRIEKIMEGKRLLEAVLGEPVTGYCGPGGDDGDLLGIDAPLLHEAGFVWLKNAPAEKPIITGDGVASYPVMSDLSWALTEENYAERLEMQKEYFRKSVAEGGTANVKLHDPFTRAGYENGLVIRWFDEVLTWLESQPGWEIEYVTLDEYYAKTTAP